MSQFQSFFKEYACFKHFCVPIACIRVFFARMCLKRKSEKTKIARPKINNQKCPPCGRTSNYRKSWAPRPQQLETPRLQKKSLSPTLVQPTSWRWYVSCIRACAKLRNTRGVFFACFVADCDGLLFADSCSWMLDQLSVEKSTIDCPKRPRRTRLAVHLACWVTRTSKRWKSSEKYEKRDKNRHLKSSLIYSSFSFFFFSFFVQEGHFWKRSETRSEFFA